jgi:hypothetical protein
MEDFFFNFVKSTAFDVYEYKQNTLPQPKQVEILNGISVGYLNQNLTEFES